MSSCIKLPSLKIIEKNICDHWATVKLFFLMLLRATKVWTKLLMLLDLRVPRLKAANMLRIKDHMLDEVGDEDVVEAEVAEEKAVPKTTQKTKTMPNPITMPK